MTLNRILTTLVQIFLVGGTIILCRMMWADLKNDFKETIKDLRK